MQPDVEHILVKSSGPVTRLVLNRPERRNALSLALMEELLAALRALPRETAVVVVEGAGPAFSAGHDLAEMVGRDDAFHQRLFEVCTELMLAVHEVPAPVIAKVHGVATAAGCQLVAACDLAVASEAAWFATPGVKIGLFCSTPMVPLVRVVGRRRALQMLMTGEPVDARTALDWGLLNTVVPPGDLDRAVDELVEQILRFSPDVISIGKRAFYTEVDLDEAGAYGHAQATMVDNAGHPDAQEGIAAFLEKRAPEWTTR